MNTDFIPKAWLEHDVPADVRDCKNCELCRQRSRMIWGEGNPNAPVVVILDNPGAREDKEGNSYVCGTRQTLQYGAHHAGLGMDDLYVTYILKCRPVRAYDKETARETCMPYLRRQLETQKPQLAFCMGDISVQWFFSDTEATVKSLRGMWHNVGGLPAAVTYHPLAVRRRPNIMPQFLSDWELLASRHFGRFI